MITVLIASSNKDIREKVKALIDQNNGIYSFPCDNDFNEISQRSSLLSSNFIIIDLNHDIKKGMSILEKIKRINPEQKAIVVTASKDYNILIDTFRRGADGYLTSSGLFNELNRCICTLLQGDKYVSSEVVNKILHYYSFLPENELVKSLILLSEKEQQHIKYIADGLNPKEIAYEMNISEKTVNNHRSRIMKKLDIDNIPGLVKYAIREQLVTL